ncbi:MAG: hypothetical protein Fur0018_25840 [Anaerolineales bacterium]
MNENVENAARPRLDNLMKALLLGLLILLAACVPAPAGGLPLPTPVEATPTLTPRPLFVPPYPTRPLYPPASLVDYTVQTGDTLPALAAHFNTTQAEIRAANTALGIPDDATTLPPGMPMKIPIYYLAAWGTSEHILPDSAFVNGPAAAGFDTAAFVAQSGGWLRDYTAYAAGANRSGAEIVDYVAHHFSVSPRLLLALLEYQSGALTRPDPGEWADYPLRYRDAAHRGVYLQLAWAADRLNDGFYHWRAGADTVIQHADGRLEYPDPWQNAATVGLHTLFAALEPEVDFPAAVASDGFAATYTALFGDPWVQDVPYIPASLQQPEMHLPFAGDEVWAYTGGPHTAWGTGQPWAAVDFAPPSVVSGCASSDLWGRAVADGVVAYVETGLVELDLDGDGDVRTGWVVSYLHIGTEGRAPLGAVLKAGDPLGHPSCEGGHTTGTHIHVARRYNGEWILADGLLPFALDGWVTHNGDAAYRGTLERYGRVIVADENASARSHIPARQP